MSTRLRWLVVALVTVAACEAGQDPTPPQPEPTPVADPDAMPLAEEPEEEISEHDVPFRAEGPIATVNGEEIPAEAFNLESRRFAKMARLLDWKRIEPYKDRIVTQLVRDELLRQAIAGAKIEVADADVDAKYARYVDDNFHTPEDLDEYYRRSGMSEERVKDDLRKSLGIEALLERDYGTRVTDAEVKAFYDENTRRFEAPEEVKARHILLRVDRTASEEVVKERKKEARKILREAKADGSDFAALAEKYSEGPTAKKGGDLGWFARKKMVPEFANAAFALQPGEISEPVRSSHGFHIIKVEERRPERVQSFDEVKDEIRQSLERTKKRDAANKLMADLRAKSKIEHHEANIVKNESFAPEPPKFGEKEIVPELDAPSLEGE